jgi:hypothetical protein
MSLGLIIEQLLTEKSSKFDLNPKSKKILLGPLSSKLNVYFEGYIANLIIGAFIDNSQEEAEFVISVFMLDDFDLWKRDIEKSAPSVNLEAPLPYKVTSPFRIFICESQSQIYLFDTFNKQGVILLRETSFLDTRSYITPFRLMVSWILDSINGEVIHASAISKNGRALVISGEKGSGKSTLALTWMITGGEIISDDAVILIDRRVYAMYARAKIDIKNIYTQTLIKYSFNLKDRQDAKNIFPLLSLGSRFVLSADIQRIIVPKQSDVTMLTDRQKVISREPFVQNSLREIFGGDEENITRLNQIVDLFDLAILETSPNVQSSIDILFKELSKYG